MTKPYGVDVSAYQGQIDFTKLLPKISFIAARATISWGYQDKWFQRNRELSGGTPFIAYHVIYPGEDVNRQADNLLRVAPYDGLIRYCIDSELSHGYTKAIITKAIRDLSERLKSETGLYPIQYSRVSWLNPYVNIADLPEMDWWLAQYLKNVEGKPYTAEHPGPPTLPAGVSTWLIHQTGSHGNGLEHGVPASANQFIDQNRWNGTEADLRAYFGLAEPQPEEPAPPTEETFRVKVYSWATPYVNVRDKPATTGTTVVGRNYPNDIVDALGVRGDWLTLLNGYSVSRYYERLTESAPEPEPEPEPAPEPAGLLDLPHYSQTDPCWALDVIGASDFRIGAKGCLLTITSAGLTFLGYPVTPKQYNRLATDRGGYLITTENGKKYANMYWKFPDVLTGGAIVRDEYFPFATGKGWEQSALAILNSKRPVWAEVRLNGYQHWVLILGRMDNEFWILDPIDGQVRALNYPQVFRVVSYKKN